MNTRRNCWRRICCLLTVALLVTHTCTSKIMPGHHVLRARRRVVFPCSVVTSRQEFIATVLWPPIQQSSGLNAGHFYQTPISDLAELQQRLVRHMEWSGPTYHKNGLRSCICGGKVSCTARGRARIVTLEWTASEVTKQLCRLSVIFVQFVYLLFLADCSHNNYIGVLLYKQSDPGFWVSLLQLTIV